MPERSAAIVPPVALGQTRLRLADEVAHVLWELIMKGELAPGTQLLQIQLAEQLGVSRTPLREAFRILERDGLVRISNGNKTVEVIELDENRLIECYQVREVIDGLAAKLAARSGLSAHAEAKLQTSIANMEAATTPAFDAGAYGEAHSEFHLTILEASGNSQLRDFASLVRLSSHMFLTRYLLQQQTSGVYDVIERAICTGNNDHRKIFELIQSGNSEGAEAAAARHIRKTAALAQSQAANAAGTATEGRRELA